MDRISNQLIVVLFVLFVLCVILFFSFRKYTVESFTDKQISDLFYNDYDRKLRREQMRLSGRNHMYIGTLQTILSKRSDDPNKWITRINDTNLSQDVKVEYTQKLQNLIDNNIDA